MVASGIGDKGERKPIMKKTVLFTTALMLTAGIAKAVHVWEDPGAWGSGIFVYNVPPENRFTANEFSLDLSGSYAAPQRNFTHLFDNNIRHTGKWGGNVGVNYFFLPYLGIGGNINMSANGHTFVDQALGNLILRWPICPIGIAPYIFGGGGRGFDSMGNSGSVTINGEERNDPNWQWFADGGVGLEWRPNATTGIFTDATYQWHLQEGSFDRLLLRFGLRLVF
jgi:hypothetical protein